MRNGLRISSARTQKLERPSVQHNKQYHRKVLLSSFHCLKYICSHTLIKASSTDQRNILNTGKFGYSSQTVFISDLFTGFLRPFEDFIHRLKNFQGLGYVDWVSKIMFCSKAFLPGLFSGELIFGRVYYSNELGLTIKTA